MRVTNKMLSNSFLSDMSINLENMKTIQQQYSSGKEIRKPSDNPFKISRAMQLETDITSNKQYKENIKDASYFLQTTDTALGQGNDALQRIRELLISAGNAGYTQTQKTAIKDEINQKIGEIGQILNTNYDGKYIFGGTRVNTKPVDVLNPVSTGVSTVTASGTTATGTVSGTYTGTANTNYKITFSVDGGGSINSYTVDTTDASTNVTTSQNVTLSPAKSGKAVQTINLGKGLTLNVNASASNAISNGAYYTFSTTVTKPQQNSKLIYNDRDGGAIPDPLRAQIADSDASSFNGSTIGFSVNGTKIDVAIPATPTLNTVQDVVNAINNGISADTSLSGKVAASIETDNSGNSYLRFTNLTSDIITIEDPTAGTFPAKLSSIDNKEIPDGQIDMIRSGMNTEISQGVILKYNVSAADLIQFNNEKGEAKDLRTILSNIVNHLDGKSDDGSQDDTGATAKLNTSDLQNVTDAINNLLKLRSEVGAKENRMQSALSKNEDETTNITEVLSKTEDIDITEKTMQYATMQTVYLASLQCSAKVLQPSLMDYLR